MVAQTAFDDGPKTVPLLSASGAVFRSIRGIVAADFFERVTGIVDRPLGIADAWGAFEDRTELIAVGVLDRVSDLSLRGQVAVVPERRRLGIGAELLHLMVHEASRQGARHLVGSHRAGAVEAERLIDSMAVTRARRVRRDEVRVVVLVPTTVYLTCEGPR